MIVTGRRTTREIHRADVARLSEKAFQQQVLNVAKLTGWSCYHTFDARHSAPGFPDLVLCRPPRIVVAELKTDKGRVGPAQERWLTTFRACPGVETYLFRPADWERLVETLQRREEGA